MLFLLELEKRSYEKNAQCVLDIQAITVQFSLRSKTVPVIKYQPVSVMTVKFYARQGHFS